MTHEDASVKPQTRRATLAVFAILATVLLIAGFTIALPVVGADPSASPKASEKAHPKPSKAPAANKTAPKDKAEKEAEGPETTITVRGPISKTTDADGDVAYTLTANGKTYRLEIGPPWWWAANNPLASKVGGTHEVTGEIEGTSDELEVFSIDGTTVRSPGKPPWAGGPKVVGQRHPGWKAWKAAHDGVKGPKGPKDHQRGADENEGPSASPGPNATTAPSASPGPGTPSASPSGEPSTEPSPSPEPSPSVEPSPSTQSSPSTEASPSTQGSPSAEPSSYGLAVMRGAPIAF
jgi:hypothetical protein